MADPYFHDDPVPGEPGWSRWDFKDETRFNALLGPLKVRRESDTIARLRMIPTPRHGNLANGVHGGVILSLIDIALFGGARACGIAAIGGGATIDLTTQFLSPGRLDRPLDAVTEILRETGRMVFMRGVVEQDEIRIAAFSGTIRKPSPAR